MSDVMLVIVIVIGVCGLLGTLFGLIDPWLTNRREDKERMRLRDEALRRARHRDHRWPKDTRGQ